MDMDDIEMLSAWAKAIDQSGNMMRIVIWQINQAYEAYQIQRANEDALRRHMELYSHHLNLINQTTANLGG